MTDSTVTEAGRYIIENGGPIAIKAALDAVSAGEASSDQQRLISGYVDALSVSLVDLIISAR